VRVPALILQGWAFEFCGESGARRLPTTPKRGQLVALSSP
jgi:hypothetical protein